MEFQEILIFQERMDDIQGNQEDNSIIRQPYIQQQICQTLSFPEAVKFLSLFKVPTLVCPIPVKDPKSDQTIVLPGVNPKTVEIYRMIERLGVGETFQRLIVDKKLKLVKILIEGGVNVDTKGDNSLTPLIQAAYSDQVMIVRELLKAGADINAVTSYDQTALLLAMAGNQSHSKTIVSLLLRYGANCHQMDRFRQSPWTLAQRRPEMLELLQRYCKT